MKTFKKYMLPGASFIIVVIVLTLINAQRTAAQGQRPLEVSIVNPLPVPVTGSVAVSGNTSTNPLLLRDVDNPARQPFTADASITLETYQDSGTARFRWQYDPQDVFAV